MWLCASSNSYRFHPYLSDLKDNWRFWGNLMNIFWEVSDLDLWPLKCSLLYIILSYCIFVWNVVIQYATYEVTYEVTVTLIFDQHFWDFPEIHKGTCDIDLWFTKFKWVYTWVLVEVCAKCGRIASRRFLYYYYYYYYSIHKNGMDGQIGGCPEMIYIYNVCICDQ